MEEKRKCPQNRFGAFLCYDKASSCLQVTVDELIAHLLSMGFDFDDCQKAIGAGMLSADSAIEWSVVAVKNRPNAMLRCL